MVMASLQMSAQKFGIRAGYTQFTPDFNGEKVDQFSDPKSLTGFHVGPSVNLNISKLLAFETGLFFNVKGYEYEQIEFGGDPQYDYTRKGQATLYGFTLPLTFKLGVKVSKSVKIVAVAGNYLAMGLSGNAKGSETTFNETHNYNEPYWESGAVGLFQKFDTGFLFGAGVEIGQLEIRASYEMGLLDIAKEAYTNLEVYNQTFNLSLGYRFKDSK